MKGREKEREGGDEESSFDHFHSNLFVDVIENMFAKEKKIFEMRFYTFIFLQICIKFIIRYSDIIYY